MHPRNRDEEQKYGVPLSRFHSSPFTELLPEAEDHLNKFLKQVGGKFWGHSWREVSRQQENYDEMAKVRFILSHLLTS